MKCIHCGRGPSDGVDLHRQNPTGQTGVWACDKHNQKPVDPLLKELTDIAHQAMRDTVLNREPQQ